MDPNEILSQFVKETKLEPGLARDLLEGKHWHYDAALRDFKELVGQRRLSTQNQAPPRQSPPRNGPVLKPAQGKSPPRANGQRGSPIIQNGGGHSPHGLHKPVSQEPPRSPGTSRLTRGLSKANAKLVDIGRQKVIEDEERHDCQLVDTPKYTFILPDLFVFPPDFRAFVEKDLIDSCTMVNLENSGHLNWWAKTGACPKLWPMTTSGDGNCLLHASSLGMWGFHDRQLTLRKALYKDLTDHQHTAYMQRLKRRWRWQQTLANKESGLVYSEEEWEAEWKALLKLASTVPRNLRYRINGGKPAGGGHLPSLAEDQPYINDDEEVMYESLEEFHVFVLCHILRRPIIVVADTVLRDSDGQPLAPIPFGGIYLPVEFQPIECHRSPLVLTYDASHFSALVPMEVDSHREPELKRKPPVIPVTNSDHQLLTLHFIVDPGIGWEWKDENQNNAKNEGFRRLVYSPEEKVQLLNKYLELVRLEVPDSGLDSQGDEWEMLPPKEDGVRTVKVEVSRSNSSGSEKSSKSGSKEKSKSFGKKLKHFAGLDKGKKSSRKNAGDTPQLIEKQPVSKNSAVTIGDISDRSIVVAAKMDDIRLQGHEEMIRNYLEAAKGRYQENIAMRRRIAAEENRSRQIRVNRVQDHFLDDDERTNETALSYTTIPRARMGKPTSSAPRSVPHRQDYPDSVHARGIQYADAGSPSSYQGNPGMERLAGNTSRNPAVQHQGRYHVTQRYQPQAPVVSQRVVPIHNLQIEARSNPYATHVRGKKVPLSREERFANQCRTFGCKSFGSERTENLCPHCYESMLRKKMPSM
ncbi:OTU domain-containing protein 7B-like [Diadema antillarum]|uniref:OTU domain-containing protein 7B-like n=1 Tax=Diadema antillarum TaxID=105358 RepID=UPI003A898A28